MAYDRISRQTAEKVALPPHTWYTRTPEELLHEPTIWQNIGNVPLNEPLLESVSEHGILSPILTMPSWYPIVGSQRIRVCFDLKLREPNHPVLSQPIRVARFDKEWWNCFYLWGDKDFRDKAIAVWFQTAELAWKSQHYIDKADPKGLAMTEFERLGDELPWKHKGVLSENFHT